MVRVSISGKRRISGYVDRRTGRQHWDVCGGLWKSPQGSVGRKRGSRESEDSPASRGFGKGSGRLDPEPTQEGSRGQHGSLTPASVFQVRMRRERAFSQTAQLSGPDAKSLEGSQGGELHTGPLAGGEAV